MSPLAYEVARFVAYAVAGVMLTGNTALLSWQLFDWWLDRHVFWAAVEQGRKEAVHERHFAALIESSPHRRIHHKPPVYLPHQQLHAVQQRLTRAMPRRLAFSRLVATRIRRALAGS